MQPNPEMHRGRWWAPARPGVPEQGGSVQAGTFRGLKLVPAKWRCLGPAHQSVPLQTPAQSDRGRPPTSRRLFPILRSVIDV